MADILQQIVAHKRIEIAAAQERRPLSAVLADVSSAPPVRDFAAALRQPAGMQVIAEVKRASPSAGLIREDFDPVAIARIYEQHGAACLSVLTDGHYFQGSLEYLRAIRAAVSLPVLRKDFILERYQVAEARAAGADAILLIAECLDDCQMRDLYFYAAELGMDSLIEIYDPENLERVLQLNPAMLGVNNRNLRTMVISLEHSLQLRPLVPERIVFVSESGIHCRADVRRLEQGGIRAMLVGETLMRSADIGAKLDQLLGILPEPASPALPPRSADAC